VLPPQEDGPADDSSMGTDRRRRRRQGLLLARVRYVALAATTNKYYDAPGYSCQFIPRFVTGESHIECRMLDPTFSCLGHPTETSIK
jgi:hypothetical protein